MKDRACRGGLLRAELSARTGCHPETVRYYEKIGILPAPPRTAAGYRVYDEGHAARLRFVLRGRELGFSLDELRGLLALVDRGTGTCAEVKERTGRHLADIRAKIADLRRIERVLAQTASRCSGEEIPECPILDALGAPSAGAGTEKGGEF